MSTFIISSDGGETPFSISPAFGVDAVVGAGKGERGSAVSGGSNVTLGLVGVMSVLALEEWNAGVLGGIIVRREGPVERACMRNW